MLPGRDKFFTISTDDSFPIKVNYINTNKGILFAVWILAFVLLGMIPFGFIDSKNTSAGMWIALFLPLSLIILAMCFVPYRLRFIIDYSQKEIKLCRECVIPKVYEGSIKTYKKQEIQEFYLDKFRSLNKRYYAVYVVTKSGNRDKIIYGQDNSFSTTFDPWLDEIPIQLMEWVNEIK